MELTRSDLHLIDLKTRMPFRYGIATMTDVPQIFVRVWVALEGREISGVASDLLPPKWFTKIPEKPLADEVAEMSRVISQALESSQGLSGATPFEVWEQLYERQEAWGRSEHWPPLLAHFGTSLVERAMLDAVCRHAGKPFAQLLHEDRLGINLGRIHPELRDSTPRRLLPRQPLAQVLVRHTVGLADPLSDDDIPAGERLNDGLPQSLEDCIRRYDLRHFKIKLSGNPKMDLPRLSSIAVIIEKCAATEFAFSLDGNEQFKSIDQFREFWDELLGSSVGRSFFRHLLFVEQPLHRDAALTESASRALHSWPGRPCMIIDESDATLHDAAAALDAGYAGSSHKNCKGVFKGVANRCLLAYRQETQPGRELIMTGEDLCNIGPVALLQDLAVMAALGIESVERNGHHYHAGLSQFPRPLQEQVLTAHPDLYERSAGGWPTLRIRHGRVGLETINRSPFGVGFTPALECLARIFRH